METKNVFITGISGCVGSYIYDLLSKDESYNITAIVRNPEKLRFDYKDNKRVNILQGKIDFIEDYKEILANTDYLIHIATNWGGSNAYHINVTKTLDMINLLDPNRIKKIVYFSTASILSQKKELISDKEYESGTAYIQTKYDAYHELKKHPLTSKVYTVFPTLVLGGDCNHPMSHISSGFIRALKHLWLLKHLSVNSCFNFIHSHDIALMTKYIIENDISSNDLVLGNKEIKLDDMLSSLCDLGNRKWKGTIDITKFISKYIPDIFSSMTTPWQKYCLKKRNFVYDVVNPGTYGIETPYKDIKFCIKDALKDEYCSVEKKIYKKIKFKRFQDDETGGYLTPLEFGKHFNNSDIPFNVNRSYFICVANNTKNIVRGRHAHHNLEQVIICLNGSFSLKLDNGKGIKEDIVLSSSDIGIYIKDLVWRELKDFSKDCVILVLVSHHYDEEDYIRNYDEFLDIVKKDIS